LLRAGAFASPMLRSKVQHGTQPADCHAQVAVPFACAESLNGGIVISTTFPAGFTST